MSRASSTATRCTAATCTVRQNARRHALRSSMFLPRSRTAPTAVSVIFGKTSPTSPSTMIQGDGASRRPTWSQIPSCAVDLSRRSRADGAQPTSGLHSPDKLPPMPTTPSRRTPWTAFPIHSSSRDTAATPDKHSANPEIALPEATRARTDHRTHRSEHRGPSPTPERPHPADTDNTERPAETMTTNSRTACPICSMTRPRRHSVRSPVATHTAAAANRLRSCEWMARSVHGSANFSELRHAQDRHPAISRCHSVATIQWQRAVMSRS